MGTSNWDGVPYFTGGKAKHSAATMRGQAYVGASGREGIIGSRDLEVRQMATPSNQVQAYPGACSIINRAANARSESYGGRLLVADPVTISPTTGSGARSDLIIAKVENPFTEAQYPKYTEVEDIEGGPYIFTRVVSGVPGTTTKATDLNLGYSAIALARVDIPANTSIITQAMIKDLRRVAPVFKESDWDVFQPPVNTEIPTTGLATWAGIAKGVYVPEWATHLTLRSILGGVTYGIRPGQVGYKNPSCALRVGLTQGTTSLFGEQTVYNLEISGGQDLVTLMAAAKAMPIPRVSRGKDATVYLQANRTSPAAQGSYYLNGNSSVSLDVEFEMRPESNA